MTESIEQQFASLLEEWKTYSLSVKVKYSSNPYAATFCEAYQKLIALGPKTLPLIRKLYDHVDKRQPENLYDPDKLQSEKLGLINGINLACLVNSIAEEFRIPVVKKEQIEDFKDSSAPVLQVGGLEGLNVKSITQHTKRWLDDYISNHKEEVQ